MYRAFSDAQSLMAWLSPGHMKGRALEYDFRQGGRYRIELTYGENPGPNSGKRSFEAVQSRTRVTVTAENVPPGISQSDHADALRSSLQNLAEYLAAAST